LGGFAHNKEHEMEFGMLIEDLRNVQAWLGHGDIQKANEYLESIIVSLESAQQSVQPTVLESPRSGSHSCTCALCKGSHTTLPQSG
jgi:hypothetical protein